MSDEIRAAFERWYTENDLDKSRRSIERDGFGYRLMQANHSWIAFQAGWRALAAANDDNTDPPPAMAA